MPICQKPHRRQSNSSNLGLAVLMDVVEDAQEIKAYY
jgi:hypothetical protein